ncbi:hypothetical protein M2404_001092 [Rheinheimera pacifica]|uniref:hypothetical protein n=1 Tax=Rheinheimera pacifica TaxID=173990 RepID=UPI00216A9376|nr:hypothetical protein [Rheinheimera pacifica]MCS4306767.1 hypothetical protein [Rheinheimera pacifica]
MLLAVIAQIDQLAFYLKSENRLIMFKILKKYAAVYLFTAPVMVNAAHYCVGKVQTVDVAGNGNLQADIEGIGFGNILCSLSEKKGEYETEACRASFSLLLAANMANKPVRLYFNNDGNTSCNKGNWLDFSAPIHGFYYIRLEG